MPACDLDRSVAFCFYNKREKPNTLVSVFSGEVHQACNLLAVTRDSDLFALLNPVEQLAKFVLCLEGTHFAHDDNSFYKLA